MTTSIGEPSPRRPRPRFRRVEVRRTERLAPSMVRVTFGGAELEGFEEPAPTQHVKLIIPEPGQTAPTLPDPVAQRGAPGADGRRPLMRTFTIRRYVANSAELQIDFVLHGEGPASQWAEKARRRDLAAVAGPGGRHYTIDPQAQRFAFIGDETALPAIGTLLESMPPGSHAEVFAEVSAGSDQLEWQSLADVRVNWQYRQPSATSVSEELIAAVQSSSRIATWDRVWVACEATTMRQIRRMLLEDLGMPADTVVTRGYWKLGEPNYPDHDYGLD
jgi:NADPH-dependent ferric siderophore reductase